MFKKFYIDNLQVMAKVGDGVASKKAGKEAKAMESFANALRQLPSIIAENGGYDSAQLCSELKALHVLGKNTVGLNMVRVDQKDLDFLKL